MEIPLVIPLNYRGQKVFTSRQLSNIFKTTQQNIGQVFRLHIVEFEPNVDYYYLRGVELKELKTTNKLEFACTSKVEFVSANKVEFACANVSKMYVWTESGVMKLAKIIGTDEAKAMYVLFALEAGAGKSDAPRVVKADARPTLSKNAAELMAELLKSSSAITDEKLRDEIIRETAKMIFNKGILRITARSCGLF